VCTEVLKRVTPSESERKKVALLAKSLIEKVEQQTHKRGIKADVRLEGSVAKNTWLRDYPEIDVFIQVPTTTPRETFGTTFLEIAKKATDGNKQVQRFAEHPYLEAVVDDVWVNIVPCYKVKDGKWVSATDRTPFHTDFVKPLLDEQKSAEARLLKRFMKGVGVYGAEIKVGGFSGYLCELLVLNYGSFVNTLKAAAYWKQRTIIDYKAHYNKLEDAENMFSEPFVMVDPVDKERNVAAAVRKTKLDEFVAASRAFLENPDLKFFYPPEVTPLNNKELQKKLGARGSAVVFVSFNGDSVVPDVLWGQLYRSQKSLRNMLERHDFKVLNDTVWSNEINMNVFLFEVQTCSLPNMKKHNGPPIHQKEDCDKFLQKHLGATETVSGPRVEDGRWVVETKRNYTDIAELLKDKLVDGGKTVGVAEFVSKGVLDSAEILVNKEIVKLYSANPLFAKFLTLYLDGKPNWL
jgi:tRNA nucleotidyltransferase (CCA-adding enzyme)